ncbi:MAG TPA: hypothetical protein VE999_23120 [Gemmataceae bacterium]|nr:hypothetical protein [Gemmataceae bacterium]
MRSIIVGASLVALLFAVGCNLAPHQRNSVGGGGVPTATPTVENLVKYLNANAERLQPGQALNCTNVTIDVSAEAGQGGVSARMQCQPPRNFLMSGLALGSPMVDVGSNDKEFWFWSKQINPPYLYHCSYDDLAQGVKVPFPFQPEMAMTALGLARYDPTKQYTMKFANDKRGHKFIELTEQARSPDNRPIQKVTVFESTSATLPNPQVVAHILKDEQGKIICEARIRLAQVVGTNGPIIPKLIDFTWPEQKMKMTMRIENPTVIDMPPEKAADRFTRQHLHYQSVDLKTQQLDGGGLERAGATAPPVYRP